MKRFFVFLLALTMILALAACGEDATTLQDSVNTTAAKADDSEEPTQPFVAPIQLVTATHSTRDDGEVTDMEYEYEDYRLVRTALYYSGTLSLERTSDGSIDRPLTEIQYDEDGSVFYRYAYQYDEKGNMVSIIDQNGEMIEACEYDESGRLIKKTGFYEGEESDWEEYHYDGDLLTEIIAEEYGTECRYVHEYDGGKLTKILKYIADDPVPYSDSYEYDKNGNLIFYTDGDLENRCEYDESGNLIACSTSYMYGSSRTEIEFENLTDEVSEEVAQELHKIVDSIK